MGSSDASPVQLTLFIAQEGDSVVSIVSAARRTPDSLIVIEPESLFDDVRDEELRSAFRECKALNPDRVLVYASKNARVAGLAEKEGWQIVTTAKELRNLLKGHEQLPSAIRAFSPASWSQDIRSKLQSAGILALPKTRIWVLFVSSAVVFVFVFFRLLPSATIVITPSQTSQNFTTNVYLVSSGSVSLPVDPERVRILPTLLLKVSITRTLTYDQISTNFTGQNATMTVTVSNTSLEPYSFRRETRIVNQAGMVFRLKDAVLLDPQSEVEVTAVADPLDQYQQVVGERGNVPAGLKWDFVGLTPEERKLVFARNEQPATGGITSYETVLKREDIDGGPKLAGAKQRLEQELLSVAREQIEDERLSLNQMQGTHYVPLEYEELTKSVYRDFVFPYEFVGQSVASIPVTGTIDYTIILYDENELLDLLAAEARDRTPEHTILSEDSLSRENVDLSVIAPWDDDFYWVKITADLTYNLRYVFDPVTADGATFGKHIRESVAGKTVEDAYRVLRNLPEVSAVDISVWPPWAFTLPTIGSNIAIKERL
ncbi:MAG: hypothetical protein ABL890_02200 [Candidatus Peribacteraceae bacterium]